LKKKLDICILKVYPWGDMIEYDLQNNSKRGENMNKEETLKKWEDEILFRHPVISCFPKYRWGNACRFFGWLPLPPEVKQ